MQKILYFCFRVVYLGMDYEKEVQKLIDIFEEDFDTYYENELHISNEDYLKSKYDYVMMRIKANWAIDIKLINKLEK